MFAEGRLTLGVFFPIEAYEGSFPTMVGQMELARRAEELGFAALWVRDVPLYDPSFGDVGQLYEPWVFLGYVAAHTRTIALATGSIILPLRHPLHVAKAAASVDQLSGGRLVLGLASGDRPVEFPAFGRSLEEREGLFRESLLFFRRALEGSFPEIHSPLGLLDGSVDLIPKPTAERLRLLVTGYSRQTLEWIATHGDGWLTYPRDPHHQARLVHAWQETTRQHAPGIFKPFAQSLYIDLAEEPGTEPTRIHLGYRLGHRWLCEFLHGLQGLGVHHVILNLKYGSRPAAEVLEELGQEVLPHFPTPA